MQRLPIIVTSGEPAGIGPDICLALAKSDYPIVIAGNINLLKTRARQLELDVQIEAYQGQYQYKPGILPVIDCPLVHPVQSGSLDVANAPYVLHLLDIAIEGCLQQKFKAMVTAPIQKSVINQAGIEFSGHTEYLAQKTKTPEVVMMLACSKFKVALVTTHLPLNKVPNAITKEKIKNVLTILYQSLQTQFSINKPSIYVTGLNPHAGENGYLGREEIEVITPALEELKLPHVYGPMPADTLFTPPFTEKADCFLAMYHDQGLTVLKYAGFGEAVNITLGLPFIRTSVDHGTALDKAGTGMANASSLKHAIEVVLTA